MPVPNQVALYRARPRRGLPRVCAVDAQQGLSPLLDYDDTRRAFFEPRDIVAPRDVAPACVVTFFGDSVRRLVASGRARVVAENAWEDGPHLIVEMTHGDRHVTLLHCGVGAPLAAGLLEEIIAMGCRAFVVCGGAGALQPEVTLGHLVVVDSALRDEGTSHHYAPVSRYINAHPEATTLLKKTLTEHGVPHVSGRTWTTDAPFRETPAKIEARRQEGCLTVEMEAAALAAVAAFRAVPLTQVLYGGDDLSGETWDHRSWQSQTQVRDNLIDLSATAALRILDHDHHKHE